MSIVCINKLCKLLVTLKLRVTYKFTILVATLGGGSNDQGGGGSQVTPEQLFEEMMTRTEL